MIGMVVVIGVAIVAGFGAYKVAEEASYSRLADLSRVNLTAAIEGRPQVADQVAWYAEPVTAALLAGGIVLIVGFMLVIAWQREGVS